MGRVKGIALALAVALAALLPDACGEVTENSATTTTSPGGATGGTKADAQGRKEDRKDDKRKRDAGMVGSDGAAGGAIPTEAYVPPCSICVRAENCCRAEGLSDCNYVATCAAAPTSEQQQFYVVLCRAVIDASSAGGKQPPDVCGF